jgi:hypothetical protein
MQQGPRSGEQQTQQTSGQREPAISQRWRCCCCLQLPPAAGACYCGRPLPPAAAGPAAPGPTRLSRSATCHASSICCTDHSLVPQYSAHPWSITCMWQVESAASQEGRAAGGSGAETRHRDRRETGWMEEAPTAAQSSPSGGTAGAAGTHPVHGAYGLLDAAVWVWAVAVQQVNIVQPQAVQGGCRQDGATRGQTQ